MKSALTLLVAALLIALPTSAAILTVDNNPGSVAMYASLEDAYTAASDGDTILLAGSTTTYSPGSGDLSYKRLTILGPGYFLSANSIPRLSNTTAMLKIIPQNLAFTGNASGTVIRGVELTYFIISNANPASNVLVESCYLSGIFTNSCHGRVTFRRCYIETLLSFQLGSSGSIVTNSILESGINSDTQNITVDRCVVLAPGSFDTVSTNSVTNTIFTSTTLTAAAFQAENGAVFSNCMSVGTSFLPAGSGNVNVPLLANVFLNTGSTDAKWQLKAGSPAATAGTGGTPMGAFGGTSPYVLSGVIGLPRLTRLAVPATATSTSGLSIDVEAQAFGN